MSAWGGPPPELATHLHDPRARAVAGEFLLQCQVACGRWRPADQAKCYSLESPQCWTCLNDLPEGALADIYAITQKRCHDFQLPGSGLSAHRRFADFLARLAVAA